MSRRSAHGHRAAHPPRRSGRRPAPPGPRAAGASTLAPRATVASSGTESSPSEAWPSTGRSPALGTPCRAARRRGGCAPRRDHGRGEIADPGEPGEGLGREPRRRAPARRPRADLAGRSAGGVEAGGSAAAAASAAAFLAAPAISTPVTSAVRSQTQVRRWRTPRRAGARTPRSRRADHQRGAVPERLGGVGRAAEHGDRPCATALATYSEGSCPSGGTSPLVSDQHRRPVADPLAVSGHYCRQRPRGTARQIRSRPASSQLRRAYTSIESASGTPGR